MGDGFGPGFAHADQSRPAEELGYQLAIPLGERWPKGLPRRHDRFGERIGDPSDRCAFIHMFGPLRAEIPAAADQHSVGIADVFDHIPSGVIPR